MVRTTSSDHHLSGLNWGHCNRILINSPPLRTKSCDRCKTTPTGVNNGRDVYNGASCPLCDVSCEVLQTEDS